MITFLTLDPVRRRHQVRADGFPAERDDIEESLMRDAHQIIAECPKDQQDKAMHYQAPAERIAVVSYCFDPQEFWPALARSARR